MTSTCIQVLTFAAAAFLTAGASLAAYEWLFRYRFAVRGRLNELVDLHLTGEQRAAVFKDLALLNPDGPAGRRSPRRWLAELLEQAGLPQRPGAFLAASGVGAAAAALVAAPLVHGWSVAVAPLGAAAPLALAYSRRHARRRQLCQQLPEAFQMMSRAVRAGQTIPSAMKIIAEDFAAPVRDEFALCYEQQNLGMSRESALRGLARRTNVMELQIFVVALLVQARAGGDLAGLLDNLATMTVKRLQLWERVRALTGEGRTQAAVLGALPAAALAALAALAPDYAQVLLDRPGLLLGCFAMQAAGFLWIRSIINIEA